MKIIGNTQFNPNPEEIGISCEDILKPFVRNRIKEEFHYGIKRYKTNIY